MASTCNHKNCSFYIRKWKVRTHSEGAVRNTDTSPGHKDGEFSRDGGCVEAGVQAMFFTDYLHIDRVPPHALWVTKHCSYTNNSSKPQCHTKPMDRNKLCGVSRHMPFKYHVQELIAIDRDQ